MGTTVPLRDGVVFDPTGRTGSLLGRTRESGADRGTRSESRDPYSRVSFSAPAVVSGLSSGTQTLAVKEGFIKRCQTEKEVCVRTSVSSLPPTRRSPNETR